MYLFDYIKQEEKRKGRKLDLNEYVDIYPLAEIVENKIKQNKHGTTNIHTS